MFSFSDINMIDLQTYRVRIGGAPAIISKILQRKAMAFKLAYGKMCHHEDEDLLRKVFQNVTFLERNQSYLLIICLVTMFSILKYLLNESHLVSWTSNNCVNWTWLQNCLCNTAGHYHKCLITCFQHCVQIPGNLCMKTVIHI